MPFPSVISSFPSSVGIHRFQPDLGHTIPKGILWECGYGCLRMPVYTGEGTPSLGMKGFGAPSTQDMVVEGCLFLAPKHPLILADPSPETLHGGLS